MKTKLKSLRTKDSYYSEDYEDDTDEMNEIEDFFCVTLNNMTKQDAKFYGKTYGLFIRPNRNNGKGYDLAGDVDQVRAMLEDYIGRYDEIGKIMNEGWYVPDWNRDGFVNPHKKYVDSKKDLKHYQITYTYEGKKDTFETYAEDEKQAIKDLKKGYDEEELKVVSVKVLDKKVKDDDYHEVAHYLLTFEDGHKEKDTIPLYIKNNSTEDEILEHFQYYHDDKIISVKQIGWSRMGDKKVKDSDEYMYYGLFQKGGSIGQNSNAEFRKYPDGILLEVYLDKEEAKEDAKRYRKNLTPGERSYYGMGYSVKPLTKSDLKHPYVQKLIKELGKNIVKDGKHCYPSCNKKVKDAYSDKYKNIKSIKEAIQAGTNADVLKNIKGIIKSRGGKIIGSRVTPERIQIEWELNGANCINTINLRESLFDIDCGRLAEDINRYSKKTVKDAVEDEVTEGHKEALEEYLQWEGIIGYDEDIIECYESGTAWVDDNFKDYEDSYDALDAYLTWEGILGYTDAIYDILKNGVESVYYDSMLREKDSYDE